MGDLADAASHRRPHGHLVPQSNLRRARTAVAFVFFAGGAIVGSWVARIPAVKSDLGLSDGSLGCALFGVAAGAVVAMPIAGRLSARRGSRRTTEVGLFACCGALLLPSLATSVMTLVPALLVLGASIGTLDVAMNAHGLAVERAYGRPILSSFHAAFSLGGLVGAGAAGLAATAGLDPRQHFAIAGLALTVPGVVFARVLLPPSADVAESGHSLGRPPQQLFVLSLLAFCTLFAEGAVADWSAVYLDGPLAMGAGAAALGFAVFSLAMVSGRLAGDRVTSKVEPVALTRGGGLLAAGSLALALIIGHPVAALIAFFGVGAGLATTVPIVFRAAGSHPGVAAGTGIAAVSTVGYIGFLAGPPAIGSTAELVGLPAALGLVVLATAMMVLLAGSTAVGSRT